MVEEARGRTRINMEEKKKKLRKEGKPQIVEEDNPILFKKAVGILTMKLFADLERKRQQNEDKISEDAKKKRERELDDEDRKEKIKEFEKNWEDSRQGRVDSWLSFRKITPESQGAAGAAGGGPMGGRPYPLRTRSSSPLAAMAGPLLRTRRSTCAAAP